MQLKEVAIHNFRGILDESIKLCDYSLLVGANNAGKSTVIDAIRAFYEKDGFKFKADRDQPMAGAADEESWAELTFELTDGEHESLKEEYKTPDKTLRLRKFFETKRKIDNKASAKGIIFGYTGNGELSDLAFYGAKNVQSGKIGDIVFIPAVSKVDEHAKLSGPSALRDLLTTVMEAVVDGSESFATFQEQFQVFAESIKTEESVDGQSLAGVEKELNRALASWSTTFNLKMRAPSTTEIIKSLLECELYDGKCTSPLGPDGFGSGFQRHFIYSLIQIGSRYNTKKSPKKAKDFAPLMTLILFEEPEAFLHPPQQEALARNLRAIAEMPSRQVVCSTHSPHFVSKNANDIPSIVRLQRIEGTVSIHQITMEAWGNIVNSNLAINAIADKYPKMKGKLREDDRLVEMEAIKHFLWLNPDRCGLFFANHVLLVEGPTEVALVNRLIGDGMIKGDHCGLYVLDCLGKFNIHRFMNLLSHLGVSHSVLHDDDFGADAQGELNQLIQDSRNRNCTKVIKTIRGEFEKMLNIPSAGPSHRKPQHALFLYETGQIDSEKIDELRVMVQGCLPRVPEL